MDERQYDKHERNTNQQHIPTACAPALRASGQGGIFRGLMKYDAGMPDAMVE